MSDIFINPNAKVKSIKSKSKSKVKEIEPIKSQFKGVITKPLDSESESNTENSLSESESESESELEVESIDSEIDTDKESDNEELEETISEEVEETEEVDKDKEIINTDYNEDGPNEKNTEGAEDLEDCLYQFDDLVDEKDTDKIAYRIPDDERKTDKQMTHYEKIRILGVRSKQIAMGAKEMIKYDGTNSLSAIDIARNELKVGMSPLIIKRSLPNNSYELWKISELKIDDDDMSYIIQELNDSYKNLKNTYEL
jgi:DNA-directed RNA polymerase I, II, and III subunit RPABC2